MKRELRNVFEELFDKSWLIIILENLPFDLRTIREIRNFLCTENISDADVPAIWHKIEELETFIKVIKIYLLPVLKERLGISHLSPERMVLDKTQLVVRRFIAYTLPHNLQRLNVLTQQFKRDVATYSKCIN